MATGATKTVVDANDTSTSYTYSNKYSKLTSVTSGSGKVTYSYSGNRISTIVFGTETCGEEYSFEYDEYGNVEKTLVGGVALSTNTYDDYNGLLTLTTYENDDTIKYKYDNLGNKNRVFYNGSENEAYYWRYDASGTPVLHQDNQNDRRYIYTYDSLGRLCREEIRADNSNEYLGYVEQGYDKRNNINKLITNLGGRTNKQVYSYSAYSKNDEDDKPIANNSASYSKDNLPTYYGFSGDRYATYDYDSINRLNLRTFSTTRPLYNNYIYYYSDRNTEGETLYRTNQLKTEIIDNTAYQYSYDDVGNITSVIKGKRTTQNSSEIGTSQYSAYRSYEYDSLDQLVRENNITDNKTYVWKYDVLGNIESVLVYGYTTGALSKPESGIDYQYTDDGKDGWNKLLTTLVYKTYTYDEEHPNGTPNIVATETIGYDAIGNPLTYSGTTMNWRGRQLMSLVDKESSTTIKYLYDADGLRGSKTVNNAKTTYTYVGDKLCYQHTANADGSTNYELYFFYDSRGMLSVIRYIKGTADYHFYVTTNMQGDVLGIYSANGDLKASYEYDAWGNCTITSDTSGIDLGNINPIRYRGYYYDVETGLYYLQSRYYNPEIGRFLNADGYITTGQGVLSFNMFAYCMNNPVMCSDYTGYASIFAVFKKVVNNVTTIIKSNSIKTFFVDLLERITSPKAQGNTCSIGYTYGYTYGGVSGNKSKTISSDTSYNYAIQETESSGAGTGGGGSFGLTFSFTNANNVNDLNGESQSWGGSFAGPIGISVEYTEFVPASNPQGKCYGFGFAISVGGEAEIHKYTNKTEMIEFYQPLVSLKEKLYG